MSAFCNHWRQNQPTTNIRTWNKRNCSLITAYGNRTCLGIVMDISNQEKTPAAPYIMHSFLNLNNMCIIVSCLISHLLITCPKTRWRMSNAGEGYFRKIKNCLTIILPESRLSDLRLSPFHILNPPRGESVLGYLFSPLPTHPPRHQTPQILQELPEMKDNKSNLTLHCRWQYKLLESAFLEFMLIIKAFIK